MFRSGGWTVMMEEETSPWKDVKHWGCGDQMSDLGRSVCVSWEGKVGIALEY